MDPVTGGPPSGPLGLDLRGRVLMGALVSVFMIMNLYEVFMRLKIESNTKRRRNPLETQVGVLSDTITDTAAKLRAKALSPGANHCCQR
jgi:hypothetical protein